MFSNYFLSFSEKVKYSILLLGIIFFFILALLPQTTFWVIVKILFFIVFISFIYILYHQVTTDESEEKSQEPLLGLSEDKQDWLQIENDQDVEELFQKFLNSVLQLIKKILVSDTVILLFVNYQKKELTLRHVVTDYESLLIPKKNYSIHSGLPSLVIKNRTPLIENHLPQGKDIIPYYKDGENPSKSFAAIPVFFKNYIVGVLCADSAVEEAYSNEDLEIVEHFGQLISVQLFGSNKLYEYESENWLANVLFDVSQEINQVQTVKDLWQYLIKKLPEIISCDRISISRKINERQGEIICLEGGMGNIRVGKTFPLSEGIVGWVMRKNQSLLVDDFSSKDNYVPRYYLNETPATEYLSLLSLPISTQKDVIAVICLESLRPKNFKEQHKRILHTICNHAATIHLTTQMLDRLKETNYKDIDTELDNLNAFKSYVPRELKRAASLNLKVSMLFLQLYFQLKEDNSDQYRNVLKEFLSLTLPMLTDTDYIFRLFPETFVILGTSQTNDQIQDLANKLMERLCLKKIWADGNAYDFYVSMGIVEKKCLTPDVDQILKMGKDAIKQAKLEGPNCIAFYNKQTENEVK